MFILWGIILVLCVVVALIIWMIMRQHSILLDQQAVIKLEQKVDALETNLQKTLEIMQSLAKSIQTQQEVLDQTRAKLQQTEVQNAELVNLLHQVAEQK